MNAASLLVVEDEHLLGRMICDNLALDGHVPELARRGDTALDRLREARFDLVILDIMLPGINGFEVLRSLRADGNETPVLILSARSSDADRIRGLEYRADDYLTKPFNIKELLLRVQALLRRARTVHEIDTIDIGDNRITFDRHELATWDERIVVLSPSEARLLRTLVQHRGSVVSRNELVASTFGPGMAATVRTLDNLVSKLRKAIERDAANPVHLKTVRGVGYTLT
ncbi:MAG: response regulator transcription factor [Planctomycetes bacterium]|nr:response regulator transcription factor [Planctomycetota bacterium]